MAGNVNITLDFSDLVRNIPRLNKVVETGKMDGLRKVADEILRLSQKEVPHDTGALQNSGHTVEGRGEYEVGYNKVYAARLHEHPEYNFQGGRKGKYMEDPIKNNVDVFIDFFKSSLSRALNT